MDDLVTRDCFFEVQDIGVPFIVNNHPVVDFLSDVSPAKSASVYPMRLILSLVGLKSNPTSRVVSR